MLSELRDFLERCRGDMHGFAVFLEYFPKSFEIGRGMLGKHTVDAFARMLAEHPFIKEGPVGAEKEGTDLFLDRLFSAPPEDVLAEGAVEVYVEGRAGHEGSVAKVAFYMKVCYFTDSSFPGNSAWVTWPQHVP